MEDYYAKEIYNSTLEKKCACPTRDSEPWIANQFCIPDHTDCPLCNEFVIERHYHCGYCTKLTS